MCGVCAHGRVGESLSRIASLNKDSPRPPDSDKPVLLELVFWRNRELCGCWEDLAAPDLPCSAGLLGPRSHCISELLEGISGSCGSAPLSDGLPCASPALSRPRDGRRMQTPPTRPADAAGTPLTALGLPLRLPPCEVRMPGPVLEAQTECTTCQEAQGTEVRAPPPPVGVPVLRMRRKLSDGTSGGLRE